MYSILYQPNSKGKFYVGQLVKYGSIIANAFFFMNFGVSSFIYLININFFLISQNWILFVVTESG